MYFDFNPGSATLWVFVAVVLFILILSFYGVWKLIGEKLDARGQSISDELEEARRLREEAQALLASYQRKQLEAEEQALEIVAQAKVDAENMAEKARRDLAERLERRAASAEAKIERAEAQALKDVRSRAAELAIAAAEDILRTGLSAKDQNALIADGIAQMNRLN